MPVFDKAAYDLYYRFNAERYGHIGHRRPIELHYNWWSVGGTQSSSMIDYIEAGPVGPVSGLNVGVIGAGFGWTAEGFADRGATVVATDISNYVLTEQSNTEEADVRGYIQAVGVDPDTDKILGPNRTELDPLEVYLRGGRASPQPRSNLTILGEDGGSQPSRRVIAQQVGNHFDWVFTEQVLNSITDAEALQVCDAVDRIVRQYNGTVVHILSKLETEHVQAPEPNWKTYEGWRALLDTNGFTTHRILPSTWEVPAGPYQVFY